MKRNTRIEAHWLWLMVVCCVFALPMAASAQGQPDDLSSRLDIFSAISSGVFQAESLLEVDPNKPMVALTFDDGPGQYTTAIVDLFGQYGGKATFFMVGSRVANNQEIVQYVAQHGHEIGTHTWSHPDLTELSAGDIQSQLTRSINRLQITSGQTVMLLRPPYGRSNSDVRAACRQSGLSIILWSIDTEDWKNRDAQTTCDAILNNVQNGSIILCHDIVPTTAAAIEMALPELIRRGYQLVTVSEMFEAMGAPLEAGRVYSQY